MRDHDPIQLRSSRSFALLSVILLGLLPGMAGAQDGSDENEYERMQAHLERAARRRSTVQGEDGLTDAQRDQIVDKAALSEGREARLIGLRERGNPHIHPGLRLAGIQEDRERSRISPEARRRRLVAMFEKGTMPHEEFSVDSRRLPPGRVEEVKRQVEEAARVVEEEPRQIFSWPAALLTAASLGLLSILVSLFRRG